MTQAISNQPAMQAASSVQTDQMLWSMLCTRRRKRYVPRGLDAAANRWIARLRHAPRSLHYLHREAMAVVAMEKEWSELSEQTLDDRIEQLRSLFVRQRQNQQELREGLAAVREVARRTKGELPYPVQLMGALGLYHGQIVEMMTGEGKTLTATVAATLLGWCGRPVHVYTVNDYLADRDARGRNPIYRRCGLHAAPLTGEMKEPDRLKAYQSPILYAAAREVMGDWLRDQLKLGRRISPVATRWLQSTAWDRPDRPNPHAQMAQTLVPGLFVAVVDEIDAILIDEAVTPLIIAQKQEQNPHEALYRLAQRAAGALEYKTHYTVKSSQRRAELNSAGKRALAAWSDADEDASEHPVWRASRLRQELVEQALVAEHCYHLGQHYQIMDDKIVIVDEYSGRLQTDRHWQNGLHQAAEAKHDLPISGDQQIMASISFQRFFQQYQHLGGMTGTAAEAKPEMERTYGLPVRVIPTHRPIQRKLWPEQIYATPEAKWQAIIKQVITLHKKGQPILIGTRSVEVSELLSNLLHERKLEHQVLNAIYHEQEADIIANAGQRGTITVATNMAGRGTDIELGKGVKEIGGLHVILTERHTARRVDRQFIGRAGRQGDPGSAQVFSSLHDELLVKWFPYAARVLQVRYAKASSDKPLPSWLHAFFAHAQNRATRQSARTRLMMMRQDHELDRSLPT